MAKWPWPVVNNTEYPECKILVNNTEYLECKNQKVEALIYFCVPDILESKVDNHNLFFRWSKAVHFWSHNELRNGQKERNIARWRWGKDANLKSWARVKEMRSNENIWRNKENKFKKRR
jgi:hypothetical protein